MLLNMAKCVARLKDNRTNQTVPAWKNVQEERSKLRNVMDRKPGTSERLYVRTDLQREQK